MKRSSLIGHAAELYDLVRRDPRPADSLIDFFFRSHKYLGSHDRRFVAETVYGLLRHQLRVDWILKTYRKQHPDGFRREAAAGRPSLDTLLLCYLYRFVMTNEDLEPSDDDLEGIALDRNNFIFFSSEIKKINLDLETKCRDGNWTAEKLSLLYSLPEWMIHQFIEQYGFEQAAAIGESLNHTAPLTLRVNTLKASVDECRAQLEKEGVATKKTKYSPFGLCVQKRLNIFQLQSFRSGLFEVQDEGSQILPLLLDPKPRSKVVDACSGGGGKSLELAALMKNRGVIFALDVNAHRLDDLRKRIRRSGSDTIRVQLVKEHNVPDSLVGVADNVLVDAPCSGLGTLRRNPGMKWTTTPDAISELSSKQYEILSEYSQCVKQNGRLVYATCTLTADENERVVEKFLTSHSDFELMRPSHILERYGLQGLEIGHYLRLFPHVHGTDGFFAAVMKRKVI